MLNQKMLDWTKLKAFQIDKLIVTTKDVSAFDGIKALWEKEKMLVVNTKFSKGVLLYIVMKC